MSESYRVLLAEETDARRWNSVVMGGVGSSPFHLWEYVKILVESYGYQFYGLVATRGDVDVAILPLLHVRSLIFGDRLISVPFSEHGGPVGESTAFPALLDAAKHLAIRLGTGQVELRDCSMDISAVDAQFSRLSRYVTFDLRLDETIENRLGKKTRNTIRRAERNLVATRDMSFDDLGTFYEVYLETQKRLGSPPHSLTFFKNVMQSLARQGVAKFLGAELDGNLIASIILLAYKGKVFWWNGVTRTHHTSLNPTTLLLWHAANWAIGQGFTSFDFGRTRVRTPVYAFKSHWGGLERPLAEYVMTLDGSSAFPDPEQRLFKTLSRGWSMLPVSFQRRLGPRIIRGIAL